MSECDSKGTGSSSKKSSESNLKNKKSLLEVWRFFCQAFSNLYSSGNDSSSLLDFFNIIQTAFASKKFGCHQFTVSPFQKKSEGSNITDYAFWVTGQCFQILVSPELSDYSTHAMDCYKTFLNSSLHRNSPVFNIVIAEHFRFMQDFLIMYKNYLKTKEPFCIRGFVKSSHFDDVELNNSKIVFATDFKIDSDQYAMNMINIFIQILDSCKELTCFNAFEFMHILEQMMGYSYDVKRQVLPLAIHVLTNQLFHITSREVVSYWTRHLVHHSLTDMSAVNCFTPLISWLINDDPSEPLDELFHSIVYILSHCIESHVQHNGWLEDLCKVCCNLLKNVSLDVYTEKSVLFLIGYSTSCSEIFRVASEYLTLLIKLEQDNTDTAVEGRRHKRKRDEEKKFHSPIWDEMILSVLNVLEIHLQGDESVIPQACTLITYLIDTAMNLSDISGYLDPRTLFHNKIVQLLLLFFDTSIRKMKVHLVSPYHGMQLVLTTARFCMILNPTNVTVEKVKHFNDLYTNTLQLFACNSSPGSKDCMLDMYKYVIELFVFYAGDDSRCDIVKTLWPILLVSIKHDSCRNLFKNSIPLLIVASHHFPSMQDKLIGFLTVLLEEDSLVDSICNPDLGNKLLCVTSGTCFVQRKKYDCTLLCSVCDSNKMNSSKLCPNLNDKLSHLYKLVELKYIEMVTGLDGNCCLLKHYLRFAKHSETLRSKSPLFKYLYSASPSIRFHVYLTVKEIIESHSNIPLFNLTSAMCIICNLMKTDEFWKGGHLAELIFQLVNLLAVNERCLIVCWKMNFLFLADCLNFGRMRVKDSVQTLVSKHNKTPISMLQKYKEDFSLVLEFLIIINLQNPLTWNLQQLIDSVKDIFDYDDGQKFLKSFCLSTLLPQLFINCPKKHLSKVLNNLAFYLGTTVKSMLVTYFDDIYTEFLFGYLIDGKKLNLVELFSKVESCSGVSIESLVSASSETLVCKFILNASHPNILFAPRFLFQPNNDNLRSTLFANMLGCLTYIDMCLQSPDTSQLVINKCFKCLPTVITLLGPINVSNMRFKLLSTLKSCLALHPDVSPQLYFTAWSNFLYSVDLRLIGPSLGSIFASLVPLVEKLPQAANLLRFLVITNSQLFSQFLPDLYFLQDSSSDKMHQIYLAIQDSISRSQGDYKDEILRILRNIGAKDMGLKLHSLNRLHLLLKQHSSEIHLLIVKSDQLHPLVVKIIDCLMSTLSDSNSSIRNVCASCIGELGAIDPGRFSYNLNPQALNKKVICFINSVEFTYVCVSGLIQGLQNAKNLQAFNKFVGAIQELLKLYFKKNRSEVCKETLFEKFVPNVREILETLLAARYRHMVPDISKFNVPHPIFGSNCGSTLEDWVYNWSVRLISFISDPFDSDLFLGCAPCMKIDIQFAVKLLPYILLRALYRSSDEERNMIEEEVKAVLHWKVYRSHKFGVIHIWKRIGACSLSGSPMFGDRSLESSRCIGIIFDLFDFLYKYATNYRMTLDPNSEVKTIQSIVKDFLGNFPHKSLFVQSYVQRDYYRSLWHIEKTLPSRRKRSQDSLQLLRNIYSKLNDADGLVGVMGSFEMTPTTEETVLCHVVRGNILDALNGYRMLSEKYPKSNFFQRALIQCYLSIDQPSTAVQITRAIAATSCPMADLFNEWIEALWSNLEMNEMEQLLSKFDPEMRSNWCWGVDLGLILSDMQCGRKVCDRLTSTRQKLVDILASLSQDRQVAYRQGYQYILKLHVLNELEKFADIFEYKIDSVMPGLSTTCGSMDLTPVTGRPMQLRLALLTPHSHDLHQVLRVRRVALSLIEKKAATIAPQSVPIIRNELSTIWIKSLTIARKSGKTEGAGVYVSMAEAYGSLGLFVEKAKLLSERNQPDAAVILLRQGITQFFSTDSDNPQYRNLCAKAKLLIAQYNDENIKVDVKDGAKYYREALDVCPWEKAYVSLAKYLYRAVTSDPPPSSLSPEDIVRMEYETAYNFGMAMMYGSKYIYQSMPCMLSLWLDFVTRMVHTAGHQNLQGLTRQAINNVNHFNEMIDKFSDVLPAYMFMTAFSQLISRMGHPYEPSFQLLKKIIVKMIITFPQQACWTYVSTLRSPHPLHKQRSLEILKDHTIMENPEVSNFIQHFRLLVNKLVCLCLRQTPRDNKVVALSSLVKGLKDFFRNQIEIMVPAQKLRSVALPYSKYEESTFASSTHYNPFPENLVYLVGVKDDVEILQSLQMPKKVVFLGSDGAQYPLICKPTDDLRLDSRIMEFNSIVNMYLRRDPKTREKNLHIRTYSVVPLSNQCGLIEWVPNLNALKQAIYQIYKKKGIHESIIQILEAFLDRYDKYEKKLTLAEKRKILTMKLAVNPPVLHEWFFDQFPNPQTWYLARRGFTRTAAVMSIVGYMEGLGDRHCENIQLDSSSGDLVHIDFNCLFNKGEVFQFPELVPFRLTQNMVKVMGATGCEGSFIRSCEETARVMRKYTDHLVATMKPFIHDPNIFTSKNTKINQLEYTNEIAKVHIENVQKRLSGVVMTKHRFTSPLSVEGQVRLLIAEATNIDNLAQMFRGWTPYL